MRALTPALPHPAEKLPKSASELMDRSAASGAVGSAGRQPIAEAESAKFSYALQTELGPCGLYWLVLRGEGQQDGSDQATQEVLKDIAPIVKRLFTRFGERFEIENDILRPSKSFTASDLTGTRPPLLGSVVSVVANFSGRKFQWSQFQWFWIPSAAWR
ncbi:hypothetical protein PCL_07295 [Purpureocillium lilacinum]|uniref:Uncharacterized protein n=1 Tax=Purpureocillium lilacinum TaxID=33203 RepID=A0A2U3DSN0_PURLI|nr:hypothetical protein PCL_07295 [Purpureocillium lilacinum]